MHTLTSPSNSVRARGAAPSRVTVRCGQCEGVGEVERPFSAFTSVVQECAGCRGTGSLTFKHAPAPCAACEGRGVQVRIGMGIPLFDPFPPCDHAECEPCGGSGWVSSKG